MRNACPNIYFPFFSAFFFCVTCVNCCFHYDFFLFCFISPELFYYLSFALHAIVCNFGNTFVSLVLNSRVQVSFGIYELLHPTIFFSPPLSKKKTIIIKNNLHLLFFFIVCSVLLFATLRTEFCLFICWVLFFLLYILTLAFASVATQWISRFFLFAVDILRERKKCSNFHASECVENCIWVLSVSCEVYKHCKMYL